MVAPRRDKRAEVPKIDRDKLRARLRRLGDECVFYMLDDALDVLSDAQLGEFVGQYVKLEEVAPDASAGPGKRSLRDAVAAFEAACRRGEYYVSFSVNSKNCMDTWSGTRSFIADCQRLFVRALAESTDGDPVEVRFAFDTLTALLRHIDEGRDDIVFFADEGGSWQVGVDWKKVFPAWFSCLAKTAQPEEFARVVVDAVDQFEAHATETHLAVARKVATPEQRRVWRLVFRGVDGEHGRQERRRCRRGRSSSPPQDRARAPGVQDLNMVTTSIKTAACSQTWRGGSGASYDGCQSRPVSWRGAPEPRRGSPWFVGSSET